MNKKLVLFHLSVIAFLVFGFYFNGQGPENTIQSINSLFLVMIGISYTILLFSNWDIMIGRNKTHTSNVD